MGQSLGAVGEGIELEDTHRAVPHDGACGIELFGQFGSGLWANVQDQVVVSHIGRGLDGGHCIASKGFGTDHISWNRHRCATGLHGFNDGFGLVQQVRLGQALANLQACGQHEGVGNAAADDQTIDFAG